MTAEEPERVTIPVYHWIEGTDNLADYETVDEYHFQVVDADDRIVAFDRGLERDEDDHTEIAEWAEVRQQSAVLRQLNTLDYSLRDRTATTHT